MKNSYYWKVNINKTIPILTVPVIRYVIDNKGNTFSTTFKYIINTNMNKIKNKNKIPFLFLSNRSVDLL